MIAWIALFLGASALGCSAWTAWAVRKSARHHEIAQVSADQRRQAIADVVAGFNGAAIREALSRTLPHDRGWGEGVDHVPFRGMTITPLKDCPPQHGEARE